MLHRHVPWKERELGIGRAKALYLAVEQTMNKKDEGPLQAVDDSEQVGHDFSHRSNLENAQYPGAPQDEELGKGFECQQSREEDLQKIRYWEVAIIPVGHTTRNGLRKPPCDLPMDGNKHGAEFPSLEMRRSTSTSI